MNDRWQDRAFPVRTGEELERERLATYLRQQWPDLEGDLEISQFPHGYSNLTYLLHVGRDEFVLRRPPFGANVRGGHDMAREYTILHQLVDVYPRVPRPLHYCADESILGAPFYLMERLQGVILRPQMPGEMAPAPSLMGQIAASTISNLAVLHAVDYEAAGLDQLGRPRGYVDRQIAGWTRRYHHAQTHDLAAMERTATWLAEHLPPEQDAALIHNDYKYDNLILDPADWSRIIGVLDWEMATIGDPFMDLGTCLGYWTQPDDPPEIQALQLSPTTLPGNPTRTEVVQAYVAASGRDVSDVLFYYVYGLFKVAVIVQQIYARYRQGHTSDPRFEGLDQAVRACGHMAQQAIRHQRIDRLG
ncbi:MAG: phosphotransferase family protein [Candidatus Promineifilaceae bacterium]|nr:phosphotransferase family protein [Candidatus Promineifilaceae bacterium]